MRAILATLLVALLALPAVTVGHSSRVHKYVANSHTNSQTTVRIDGDDNCELFDNGFRSIDIKRRAVVITYSHGEPERVEVNSRHELIVDGVRVKFNNEQQELVSDFYEKTMKLVADAKEIGLEGAAIGLHGAGVAAKAVAGVFEMLFTSYTSEDLERDVERAAAKVEARASKLEAKADRLEELADEIEELYEEMEDNIPALRGEI